MSKKFEYGSCIPESKKIYRKLKKQGKNPIIIEGYVTVGNPYSDILPDIFFLARFFPEEVKKLGDTDYNDYTKSLQHTWVELRGIIIDRTVNQFDRYGGVLQYYETDRYELKR